MNSGNLFRLRLSYRGSRPIAILHALPALLPASLERWSTTGGKEAGDGSPGGLPLILRFFPPGLAQENWLHLAMENPQPRQL